MHAAEHHRKFTMVPKCGFKRESQSSIKQKQRNTFRSHKQTSAGRCLKNLWAVLEKSNGEKPTATTYLKYRNIRIYALDPTSGPSTPVSYLPTAASEISARKKRSSRASATNSLQHIHRQQFVCRDRPQDLQHQHHKPLQPEPLVSKRQVLILTGVSQYRHDHILHLCSTIQ